jgi:hypothetical protein
MSAAPEEASNKSKNQWMTHALTQLNHGSIILHISQVGWHQIDDSFVELGDWIQHKND